MRAGGIGNDTRECGLARAGWSPEYQRGKLIGFDSATEQGSLTHQLLVSGQLIKCAWPHARGKRRLAGKLVILVRAEEIARVGT